MREQVQNGTRTLETFRLDVGQYLAQQQQIQDLAATVDCGIVQVNLQVQYHMSCIICCFFSGAICNSRHMATAFEQQVTWLLLLHAHQVST